MTNSAITSGSLYMAIINTFLIPCKSGLWSFNLCLVLVPWNKELNLEVSKFVDRNLIMESMYWEGKVSISNFWKYGLQAVLWLNLVIILVILFFAVGRLFYLLLTSPKIWHNSLLQHENGQYKPLWEWLCYCTLHHSNKTAHTTYFRHNFVNMILPIYIYVKF
jgi:hypothetical protein